MKQNAWSQNHDLPLEGGVKCVPIRITKGQNKHHQQSSGLNACFMIESAKHLKLNLMTSEIQMNTHGQEHISITKNFKKNYNWYGFYSLFPAKSAEPGQSRA